MLRTSVRSLSYRYAIGSFSVAAASFFTLQSIFGSTYDEDSFRGVIEC